MPHRAEPQQLRYEQPRALPAVAAGSATGATRQYRINSVLSDYLNKLIKRPGSAHSRTLQSA